MDFCTEKFDRLEQAIGLPPATPTGQRRKTDLGTGSRDTDFFSFTCADVCSSPTRLGNALAAISKMDEVTKDW
eukprot:CAMPEP_0168417080 /NCGR_PEP_ID=MMETSP0228-20121227/31073_1 /TAXON_ID=133427 /ORGANISM="Protoceratium reticulatum, Strain CCCM 535 (=CCMP 1889)" /LENGTH=72 /DNA_ID=CAMNT_0008430929 /DNA_START=15 /DNA_END=230 /DNA_ORIENTATION=-